jgi:hypothetical protein
MDYEPIIEAFADLANAYCKWAEGETAAPKEEQYRATLHVAKLYLAGLELPITEPIGDLEIRQVTNEDYKRIHKRFATLPFQYYWELFNPLTETPEEPVMGDICDDLADMYRDLKNGLFYWDKGERQNAVFQWKTSFGFHWGRHATSALRVLHCFETNEEE